MVLGDDSIFGGWVMLASFAVVFIRALSGGRAMVDAELELGGPRGGRSRARRVGFLINHFMERVKIFIDI